MSTNKEQVTSSLIHLERKFILENGIGCETNIHTLRKSLVSYLTSNLNEHERVPSIIDSFGFSPLIAGGLDEGLLAITLRILGFSHINLNDIIIVRSGSTNNNDMHYVTVSEYLLAKGVGLFIETRNGKRMLFVDNAPSRMDKKSLLLIRTYIYEEKFIQDAFKLITPKLKRPLEIAKCADGNYKKENMVLSGLPQYIYERADEDSKKTVSLMQGKANSILFVLAYDHVMLSGEVPEVNFNFSGYKGIVESKARISELKESNLEYSNELNGFLFDDEVDKYIVDFLYDCIDYFVDSELSNDEKNYLLQNNTLSTLWGRRISYKLFIRYVNYPNSIFTPSTIFFAEEQQKKILMKIIPLSCNFHKYKEKIKSQPEVDESNYLFSPELFMEKRTNKLIKAFDPEGNLNAHSKITVRWKMKERLVADPDGRVALPRPYPQKPAYNGTIIDILKGRIDLDKAIDAQVDGYSISGISTDLYKILKDCDLVDIYLRELMSHTTLQKRKYVSKIESQINSNSKGNVVGYVSLNKSMIFPMVVVYHEGNRFVARSISDGGEFVLPVNSMEFIFTKTEASRSESNFINWLKKYLPLGRGNERIFLIDTTKLSDPIATISIKKNSSVSKVSEILLEALINTCKRDIDYITTSKGELQVIKTCQSIKQLSLLIGIITAPLLPLTGLAIDLSMSIIVNAIEMSALDTEEQFKRVYRELGIELAMIAGFTIAPYILKSLVVKMGKGLSKITDARKKMLAKKSLDEIYNNVVIEGVKEDLLLSKLKALIFDSRGGDFSKVFKFDQVDGGAFFKQKKIIDEINNRITDYKPDGYCRGLSMLYVVDSINGKPAADIIESIGKSLVQYKEGRSVDIDYIIKNQLNQLVYFSAEKSSSQFFKVPASKQIAKSLHDAYLEERGAKMINDADSGPYSYHENNFKTKKYYTTRSHFLIETDNHAMALTFNRGKGTFFDPNCGVISFNVANDIEYQSFLDNMFKYIKLHYIDDKWGNSTVLTISKIGKGASENPIVTPRSGLLPASSSIDRMPAITHVAPELNPLRGYQDIKLGGKSEGIYPVLKRNGERLVTDQLPPIEVSYGPVDGQWDYLAITGNNVYRVSPDHDGRLVLRDSLLKGKNNDGVIEFSSASLPGGKPPKGAGSSKHTIPTFDGADVSDVDGVLKVVIENKDFAFSHYSFNFDSQSGLSNKHVTIENTLAAFIVDNKSSVEIGNYWTHEGRKATKGKGAALRPKLTKAEFNDILGNHGVTEFDNFNFRPKSDMVEVDDAINLEQFMIYIEKTFKQMEIPSEEVSMIVNNMAASANRSGITPSNLFLNNGQRREFTKYMLLISNKKRATGINKLLKKDGLSLSEKDIKELPKEITDTYSHTWMMENGRILIRKGELHKGAKEIYTHLYEKIKFSSLKYFNSVVNE